MVGLLLWAGLAVDSVTLPAAIRTGDELARDLSADGRTVTAQGQALARCSVVRLTDRSWEETMSVISEGLGVVFRDEGDGRWTMITDPEREQAASRSQVALGYAMRDGYKKILVEISKLSTNPFPPKPDWMRDQIEAALRTPGEGNPRSNFTHPLFNAALPWERRAALAAVQGVSSSTTAELKNPGPTYYYFEKNKSALALLAKPWVETGDAYYWRDKAPYPAWVRERALSMIRGAEAKIAQRHLPPDEAAIRLDAEARWTFVTHRLWMDAFTGVPRFEYSVLAMGEEIGGWFDSDTVPAYTWSLQPEEFKLGDPGFADRQTATQEALTTPFFESSVTSDGPASVALAMAANQEKRDLVYPIWWTRDRMIPSAGQTGLGKKLPFAVGIHQIGAALPAWTVVDKSGVLVFRNELEGFDFLDWKDGRILADLTCREKEGPARIDELIEMAGKLTEATAPALARQQAGRIVGSWLNGYPILAVLKGMPQPQREDVLAQLRDKGTVQIDLADLGSPVRVKLQRSLLTAFREDPNAGSLIQGEDRHSIVTQVFSGPSTQGYMVLAKDGNNLNWMVRAGASEEPPEWMVTVSKFPKTVGMGKIEKISLN
jgi:hypothetical protein